MVCTFVKESLKAPKGEFFSVLQKEPSMKYSSFGSRGHAVSLLRCAEHLVAIVVKPLFYLISSPVIALGGLVIAAYQSLTGRVVIRQYSSCDLIFYCFSTAVGHAASVLIVPFVEILQSAKALAGIIHPPTYFRVPGPEVIKKIHASCRELCKHAKKVGMKSEFIKALSDIPTIFLRHHEDSPIETNYCQQTLQNICHVLATKNISAGKIHAMFSLIDPEGMQNQGIKGCIPGICNNLQRASLGLLIPDDLKDLMPYISSIFKYDCITNALIKHGWHNIHDVNSAIVEWGQGLHLPADMIELADRDSYKTPPWKLNNDILTDIYAFCTKEKFHDFLKNFFFSQGAEFQGKLIDQLADQKLKNISDEEIQKIQEHFNISPKEWDLYKKEFCFQYFYSEQPDDETCLDLNEKAIEVVWNWHPNGPDPFFYPAKKEPDLLKAM